MNNNYETFLEKRRLQNITLASSTTHTAAVSETQRNLLEINQMNYSIFTDVIEQLLLAKMKNYRSFEYKIPKIDSIIATQIATIAKIKFNNTIDSTIFFTEIDPTNVERLDNQLNLYTTKYTYKLCENAAFQRVKQCLLIDHVKPPLWAVESLSRTIKSKKNSKYTDENKKLLENTVSKYPEFLYLTH